MSADFLRHSIRGCADGSLCVMSGFLHSSLKLFLSGPMQHLVRAAASEDPTQTAGRLATENYERWCSARSEIFGMLAKEAGTDSAPEADAARPSGPVVLDGFDRGPRRSAGQLTVPAV